MNHSRGRAGAGGLLVLEGASLPDNAFMMLRERAKPGRAAKFCLVGGTGTVINTAVLYVLDRRLGLPLLVSSPMAVEIAVLSNHLLTHPFTFAPPSPPFSPLPRFTIPSP